MPCFPRMRGKLPEGLKGVFSSALESKVLQGWNANPVLLTFRRLPKLDLVAFRVDHPAELALFGALGLVEHIAAFRAQRGKQPVEVRDAEVDHEGRGARRHVVRVLGERT